MGHSLDDFPRADDGGRIQVTVSTSTHTGPRKPTARPSVARLLASKYLDLLICGFFSWIICFAFGWQTAWASLTIIFWVGEWFWCRDRLNPTAGEYCLGIRYLTSSSSQVVADIQVIHNKLKLNEYLLIAGVVELTFAILFFCGWTFLGKAVFLTLPFGPPLSMVYWMAMGFIFFMCSGYLLSGSRQALWTVPLVHFLTAVEFLMSYPVWKNYLENEVVYPAWFSGSIVMTAKSQSFLFLELFIVWSLFVCGAILFSRKHLVN